MPSQILKSILFIVVVITRIDSAIGNEFKIVGYLPDYRLASVSWENLTHLTDLILFSAEVKPDGNLDLRRFTNVDWNKFQQLKKQSGVRLILSVGGWGRSEHFKNVAAQPNLRARFAAALVEFCKDKQWDGIDIDWEHPHGGIEERDYGLLLQEIHAATQPNQLSLSVTVAAWQRIPKTSFQWVDSIQIMSYDHDGKHATLDQAKEDLSQLMSAGAEGKKLVLGLPFYGRGIQNREKTLTYRELFNQYRLTDDRLDEVDGIYFNGRATIEQKVFLAQSRGLAGVMIWEVGQDAPGDVSLLGWIAKCVAKNDRIKLQSK